MVFLITGPSAAGKSTVARLLAQRFARGVHLEGDLFRRAIVAGRAEMSPALADDAVAQLRLRYRLTAQAADTYARAGYVVVLEDVAAGEELPRLADRIETRPLHVAVLLPRLDVVAARDAARSHTGYARFPLEDLYAAFSERTPRIGTWLDTSDQTPGQTVEELLALTR